MAKRRFRSRGRFKRLRRGGRGRNRRLKKFVKGVVRRMSEIKYNLSSGHNTLDVGNFPFYIEITPPVTTGATKFGRIGNQIKYRYLTFTMQAALIKGATWANTNKGVMRIRTMIVQPRNSAAPNTASAIWDDVSDINSCVDFKQQRVLYDKTRWMAVYPYWGENGCKPVINFKVRRRINNNVKFSSGVSAAPNDYKDRYWLILWSTDAEAVGKYSMEVNWFNKISFTDI